jgi:hypothetical protein
MRLRAQEELAVEGDVGGRVVQQSREIDWPLMRVCTWCFWVMTLLLLVGLVLVGHFIPPVHPSASAAEVAAFYQNHTTAIRLSVLLQCVALAFWIPWGSAVAVLTRRVERGVPILTYCMIVFCGASVTINYLYALAWAVASFRPERPAEITRTFNDFGWVCFQVPWAPYSIWTVLVAIVAFTDRDDVPLFPRWFGYLSIWACIDMVPAGLMIFFKEGPFAFNGLITLYFVLAVFFGWAIVLTFLMLRAINRFQIEDAKGVAKGAEWAPASSVS